MPLGTFKKMLNYFYSGAYNTLDLVDAGWILALSEYYLLDLDSKLIKCCHHLKNTVNWVEAYVLGLSLEDTVVQEKALASAVPPPPQTVADVLQSMDKEIKQLKAENRELKQQLEELRAYQ